MKVINITKQQVLGEHIKVADSFFTRLVGLLATPVLPPGTGLLIKPCSSVHTFGMRYPIDLVFIDSSNRVVKVVAGLKACRLAAAEGAAYVLELPAGRALAALTQEGDILVMSELK